MLAGLVRTFDAITPFMLRMSGISGTRDLCENILTIHVWSFSEGVQVHFERIYMHRIGRKKT